jgi:hypothetical protein
MRRGFLYFIVRDELIIRSDEEDIAKCSEGGTSRPRPFHCSIAAI